VLRILVVVSVGACATGARSEETPDSGPRPDGAVGGSIDAPDTDPDGSVPPADTPGGGGGGSALLVTEVALAPTTGEFIEIANPTAQTVDLSTYYLSDSGAYFRLPTTATVDSSDFIVRFPAGATIAPGAVVTVAIDTAASFQTVYGAPPTFSIASATMTTIAVSGTATLTNSGEPVVLFRWDGQGDLVSDVDMVIAGVPTSTNLMPDKSGQAFDGPDTGSTTTAYGPDARTIAAQPTAPGSGLSTKRIARETGHEVQNGSGNGIAGDDETSEDTSSTWDTTFTAPTPGSVPIGVL
jgi:uncharacterized protein